MQQKYSNATCACMQASSWLYRNASLEADLRDISDTLKIDLAHTTTELKIASHNVAQRPTLGLFGASQAGKSYLVSVLAAGGESQLLTTWDGTPIDFLKHVNPSGHNSEATGFVTRFSHVAHATPKGFPVELAVLSEIELAMIMVNSFYNDINPSDIEAATSEEAFLAHLESCQKFVDEDARLKFLQDSSLETGEKALFAVQNSKGHALNNGETSYVSFADVIELADYGTSHSRGKLPHLDKWPTFWHRLGDMLPFMPLEGRVQTLSVLWQQQPIFTETFRFLAGELLKLQGRSTIYAPLAAFVEQGEEGMVQRENGTIIHITKLSAMFEDSDILTCSLGEGAPTLELSLACVAALSRELRFTLHDKGYIDQYDILDMPGARTRDDIILKDMQDDSIGYTAGSAMPEAMQKRGTEFFRRGKVAYLFDRCARTREMEQLLFCIGVNAQQDVSVLSILSDWIETTIGATPEQRAQSYNPLTIVFTRYDEVFNRQLANLAESHPLAMDSEINIAFNRIVKFNWFNEWTPNKPFNRLFLARRPCLGPKINPWLEFDPATNEEKGIKADSQANIKDICDKLKTVDELVEHVVDIDAAIEAVLALNDGGVTALAENIKAGALTAEQSVDLNTQKARQAALACATQLRPFAQQNGAEALEEAKEQSRKLCLSLLQCNAFYPCLHLIRPLMEIRDYDLEAIYRKGFTSGSNVNRFVNAVCDTYVAHLESFTKVDNPQLLSIADKVTAAYMERRCNIESQERSIAEKYFPFCIDATTGKFKEPEAFKNDVIQIFIQFFREVVKTFSAPQIDIKSYMDSCLREYENVNEGFEDVVRLQVQTISFILSDFNLYLGTNLLPSENLADRESQEAVAADPFADLKTTFEIKSVLGTENGPVNAFAHKDEYILLNPQKKDYDVYDYSCPCDSTGILPKLNDASADYVFRFASDFCSVLMYMMCRVNAVTESKYKFTSTENLLLCQILQELKL